HYKPAFSLQDTVQIIVDGRGKHFDPDIVDAFIGLVDVFTDIAERYADAPAPPMHA
ncbi:MAG: hypothetical protein RJA34_1453, partial [Pseudomonadota bacterium]